MSKIVGYALALTAQKRQWQENHKVLVVTVGWTGRARSKEEAIGIGIEMVKAKFPGYDIYDCQAMSVEEDLLAQNL